MHVHTHTHTHHRGTIQHNTTFTYHFTGYGRHQVGAHDVAKPVAFYIRTKPQSLIISGIYHDKQISTHTHSQACKCIHTHGRVHTLREMATHTCPPQRYTYNINRHTYNINTHAFTHACMCTHTDTHTHTHRHIRT